MKKFTTQEIRDLYNRFFREEISFSRMVEIMNERVSEAEKKCVEDIPKRKFQKGDKVRIKEGISSKTHESVYPFFISDMDEFIGTTMTVDRYTNMEGCVVCNESDWRFHEDWLEPYEELKKGDLVIFWHDDKRYAALRFYEKSNESKGRIWHKDTRGFIWENAIKFESKEQFERFIKGEI